MMRLLPALILAASCSLHADPLGPVSRPEVTADPLTVTESTRPITADQGPADWSARIEPASPRWDQDLRCVVDGLPGDTPVAVAWTVNGQLFQGTTEGARPGDTVPHLLQAGGQTWGCSVATDDEVRTAATVVVEPPLPMALVHPGSFQFSAYAQRWDVHDPVTITRAYWVARYEVTHAQFQSWMGYQGDEYWDGRPNTPIIRLSPWEAQRMANLLSALDGLPECYVCEQLSPDRMRCLEVDDLPSCSGYRLPTAAEWEFASTSGGMHNDPLPAGGIWAWISSAEIGDTADFSYDPPAVGPNAPLNTLVSDQCWFWNGSGNREVQDVGQLIPNALGLYDMCGNAGEFVSDNRDLNPAWEGRGFVDPRSRPGATFAIGGGVSGLPTGSWSRTESGDNTTIRLVRTNTPVPVPGGQP